MNRTVLSLRSEDKTLTGRVKKLREQSVSAVPYITPERALLLTEFFRNGEADKYSPAVTRARAFRYILQKKEICINDGELIVGERGPAPKAVPTYPELTTHSLNDLKILNSRKKIPYKVSTETKNIYEDEIIPFWTGRTIRENVYEEMDKEWHASYEAGIFTEFMEQRAPGHTVLDDKIYSKGMDDFDMEIERSLRRLDYLNDPLAYNKREQLKAMRIVSEAIVMYAWRHAAEADRLAEVEKDSERKKELNEIAEICRNIPQYAPKTFREALQYYWFVHLGVITELNPWDAFNPGKLDQHLYPFYVQDIKEGRLTKEEAHELLQLFWIKFNNQPSPPKVGVTAEESNTYTDFVQINSGGVKPDGSDAVNEISYMIMDVVAEMKLIQPSPSVQISKKTPDRFLKHVMKVVRKGYGQPSIFNTDAVVQEMVRQGKSLEDARCGGTSGCVETGAFGKENYNLTGYFNLPKIFEITLNDGVDPRTGKKIGVKTGDPATFTSFDQLFNAFEKQMRHFIDIKIKGNNIIERIYADRMPVPFLSLLIDDCIAAGVDYHNGGARYNTSYIQGVGIGSITDAMSAVKYAVFDQKKYTMKQLLSALKNDYKGKSNPQQYLINKTPKYGNDDDYADSIMKQVFQAYHTAIDGRPNTKGGEYRINMLPTTCHVYFGSVTGATADGRKAWEPLSEGISPVQGADRNGPTSVVKSVAKMDHVLTGGTLLNMKFTPQLLDGEDGIEKLSHLVRSYFKLDGHHVQFNVVDINTLKDAQKNPDKHRDLIVRVAGYSDYFVDLGKKLQDEIILRTEHADF
ncbi:trans-4-hydroxy-L-proline dehydratase [candidate division KSB1 bacterium]